MLNKTRLLLIGICLINTISSCNSDEPYIPDDIEFVPYTDSMIGEITNGVFLADPFILLYNDVYYAYGTTSAYEGFRSYTSSDLYNWKLEEGFVLWKDDVGGTVHFWAPEVYYHPEEKKFLMFYSADRYSWVAVSDSPLGPFKAVSKNPIVNINGIDGSLYVENGNPYFYMSSDDIPSIIKAYELNADWQSLKSTNAVNCFSQSQKWENFIQEGPCVFKYGEWYYMTYSSWGYDDDWYGAGYATSKSPLGPWTKHSKNPFLQFPKFIDGILYGSGHNSIFKDKEGNLKIVFHTHRSLESIMRVMFIADIVFQDNPEGGAPVMKFENIFCPQLIKE